LTPRNIIGQHFDNPYLQSAEEGTMDAQSVKVPRLRRAKKNFVVEENIDAVRWPQECANCGGRPEVFDSLKMAKEFKGVGNVTIEVQRIPYCQSCFPKIRRGKRLFIAHWVFTLVIGLPLGILWIVAMMSSQEVRLVVCGFHILLSLIIAYLRGWLVIKLPAKLILGKGLAKPVDGWPIEEKKQDGKEGLSVVLVIPREDYALKFAELNAARA
jgi:hypothetical protein